MADRHQLEIVAACYASPYLGLVLLAGGAVVDIRASRVRQTTPDHLRLHLGRFLDQHQPERIVLETGLAGRLGLTGDNCAVAVMTITEAKRRLLPQDPKIAHVALYQYLLRRDPRLERFVAAWPTRWNSWRRPWQRARLLAIALALAALDD